MAETMTEIAKTTPSVPAEALRPEGLPIHAGGVGAAMESWKLACSMGKAYAQQPEGMVPKNYAGNPASCTVACSMAIRMGADPLFVMQNLYVVSGNPTWSGKSCKALIDNSGIYAGRSRYELTRCRGHRFPQLPPGGHRPPHRGAGGRPTVSIKMAKDSGWWTKNGSYWPRIPEMMLRYRAAAYFARAECPEVLMGATVDMDGDEG